MGRSSRARSGRFVPRISFFFNAHNDFFEEIANTGQRDESGRALMRERFGARTERTMQMRFTPDCGRVFDRAAAAHNIVRVAIQASGVLGGHNRCTRTLMTKHLPCRLIAPR